MLTKEEYIKKYLSGWSPEAAGLEYERVMVGDRFDACPLGEMGFRLIHFSELPTVVVGPDDKCICTKDRRCLNVDRRDGNRCTLRELQQLNTDAMNRRARQAGEDF